MGEALAVKYRPQTFSEVVGNRETVAVLQSFFSGAQPVPHALLFHGPTGCGKTTLARIVAQMLECSGQDLQEVDAADFRGIDTAREIRRNAMLHPLYSRCRVWILDECHRLTNDAQSALLKVLEDAPPHAYFILCTTDPQKLLPTIRSRCSQLQLGPLSEREMLVLLRRVVVAEGASLSRDVYMQIVADSLGHPRMALQILAQVLVAPREQQLSVAKRAAELESKVVELCRALVGMAPWKRVASLLQTLRGEDPESVRRAVLGYCQAVLLKEQNDAAAAVMDEFLRPFYDSGFPALVLACYAAVRQT